MARTDARGPLGMAEAITRCKLFWEAGADFTFLEAPQSETEMREYCTSVPGPKMANMLRHGSTPSFKPRELGLMGFTLVAYPLDLLNASIRAYERCLGAIASGNDLSAEDDLPFERTQEIVGFHEYWAEEKHYGLERNDTKHQ